jgi:hypothetical protein
MVIAQTVLTQVGHNLEIEIANVEVLNLPGIGNVTGNSWAQQTSPIPIPHPQYPP